MWARPTNPLRNPKKGALRKAQTPEENPIEKSLGSPDGGGETTTSCQELSGQRKGLPICLKLMHPYFYQNEERTSHCVTWTIKMAAVVQGEGLFGKRPVLDLTTPSC